MVHPSVIEARLGKLGFRASRWFNAEIRELEHILMDHEEIIALVCGRYFGSFALLVATDQRLLLIDKRVFFMTVEDTRYDMISEIDFNMQAYAANVTIFTMNKTHKFSSVKYRNQLRELTKYVQLRVMEFRNQQTGVSPGVQQTMQVPQPAAQARAPQYEAPMPLPEPGPAPIEAPPLGASYNYSPATQDDIQPVGANPPVPGPGVAQMVGSAAMQASRRPPMNPYLQGSLMSRGPLV